MAGKGSRGSWQEAVVRFLAKKEVLWTLLVLNALVTLGILWASRGTILSDTWSYLGLAEGILHGQYSMWWPLGDGYPDTFRTPGYPLFVAFFLGLFGNWHSVLVAQFILYALSIYLALRTIDLSGGGRAARSVFLIILVPMVNVPFYIGQLYTEIPVMAAIGLAVYLAARDRDWTWRTAVAIGLLMGFIFQCRPAFLLFPVAYAACALVLDRPHAHVRELLLMLAVFGATLLPFGFWSLANHGVFKVTPLQGAGSYMHLGYWSGKTPGYTDHFYLGNFNGDEVMRFTPKDSVPANIRAYEEEWNWINGRINPLLTAKDTAMREAQHRLTHTHPTYNTAYTMLREKLLMDKAVQHYLDDPWYTLAFKSYSAVRLWVIGIQVGEFRSASAAGKLQMLFATLGTGLVFLVFIIFVPLAYLRGVLSVRTTWPILLYLAYSTVIHLPFTIQSRYTVPVRLLMFILMAMAIMGLLKRPTSGSTDNKE